MPLWCSLRFKLKDYAFYSSLLLLCFTFMIASKISLHTFWTLVLKPQTWSSMATPLCTKTAFNKVGMEELQCPAQIPDLNNFGCNWNAECFASDATLPWNDPTGKPSQKNGCFTQQIGGIIRCPHIVLPYIMHISPQETNSSSHWMSVSTMDSCLSPRSRKGSKK